MAGGANSSRIIMERMAEGANVALGCFARIANSQLHRDFILFRGFRTLCEDSEFAFSLRFYRVFFGFGALSGPKAQTKARKHTALGSGSTYYLSDLGSGGK